MPVTLTEAHSSRCRCDDASLLAASSRLPTSDSSVAAALAMRASKCHKDLKLNNTVQNTHSDPHRITLRNAALTDSTELCVYNPSDRQGTKKSVMEK